MSKSPRRVSNLRANRARSNGLAVTPRRCEIRCITRAAGAKQLVPPSSEGKKGGTGGKKGRKKGSSARRRTRARSLLHGRPFFFGGFPLLFLLERGERRGSREREKERESSEKGGPRRGHVSRPGHLPLKRTHCYVPIISFTLAQRATSLSRPSSSSFSSATCLPFVSLCLGTSSCPFPLHTKAVRTYAPALRRG